MMITLILRLILQPLKFGLKGPLDKRVTNILTDLLLLASKVSKSFVDLLKTSSINFEVIPVKM